MLYRSTSKKQQEVSAYYYSYYYYKYRSYIQNSFGNSNFVYSIPIIISGLYNLIRAKISRINANYSNGVITESSSISPYVYSRIVDSLADYTGYKIRCSMSTPEGYEGRNTSQEEA